MTNWGGGPKPPAREVPLVPTHRMLAGKCLAFVLGREFYGTKAPNFREIIRVIDTITFPDAGAT